MHFIMLNGLPFLNLKITNNKKELIIKNVLIDTGSGGTCFNADDLEALGVRLTRDCTLKHLKGIGGSEWVFETKVDSIGFDDIFIDNFKIEVGDLNYGFGISGILGSDFMEKVGLKLDFEKRLIFK